jgi:hypothetical protein
MKVLTGHLTATDKKAVLAILNAGLEAGKVGSKTYFILIENGVYSVKYQKKDRGLIPTAGSQLRISTYNSTFTI